MARLVPLEVTGGEPCAGKQAKEIPVVDGEADGEGGCGSANGRTSGGEMADMEKKLQGNESEGREIEITTQGQRHDRIKPARQQKKLRKQQMGQCSRCGYLSSQAICKACMLLEGLNKNRPKMEIQVGIEEEDNSPTLTRRMEGLKVIPGQQT